MAEWREWHDILGDTHIRITPETKELAEKYHVPVEVLASVKGDKRSIALAIALAEDRQINEVYTYYNEEATYLGVPVGIRVLKGRLTILFRSGAKIVIPDKAVDGKDPVEIVDMFKDYVLIKAKRNGQYWIAKAVKRAIPRADTELARRVIEWFEANGYTPGLYYALLLAMNYSPELPPWHVYDILPRAIPVVNERTHTVYLSVPGTGKTYTAILWKHALAWDYLPKPPTPARLVGDARTGVITGVKHNGIWLDEFDKWARASDARRLAEAIELMLTGMENCEWVREAGGALAPRTTKCVPFIITGNLNPLTEVSPRSLIRDIVGEATETGADAFEERISIAVINTSTEAKNMIQYGLADMTPKTAYIRGVFKVWREELLRLGGPVHGGKRIKRHLENVKRTIRAIGLSGDHADRVAEDLVFGIHISNNTVAEWKAQLEGDSNEGGEG